MVKPPILRTKSITTKVTEAEYQRLEKLAEGQGRSMSEWVREKLLGQAEEQETKAGEEVLLAEVLGLRTILINLLFSIGKGEVVTDEHMQELIERADGGKVEKARKLLSL